MSDSPPTSDADSPEPWYGDGLHFRCTECGNCCTGAPGTVWVDEDEINALAAFLGKPVGEIRLMHTRRVGRRVSLNEYANGDCIYFDGEKRGCTVYSVRPKQCRTWPFWNSNLRSESDWKAIQKECPGAGHGDFVPLEEIEIRASQIDL